MRTYSHAVLTWALARRLKANPAAAALGAVLPDLPALAKGAALWPRRKSMTRREFCAALYSEGISARLDVALHSAVPAVVALALGLKLKGPARRAVLSLALGWLGHDLADFVTHSDHARPQLWPLSDFRWKSPISYRNPERYGAAFTAAEHAAVLAALRRGM
jgi:hypothetical protein